MTKVIGVRFRTAGKIYFFDPLQFEIKRGDHVIVETARGIEFGTVMSGVTEVAEETVVQPLKPVIRIANQRDMEQEAANKIKEKDAFKICLEKIQKHGLEMKLIDAEYTFDNNKVLFYFTADGRIDFRELVKDLASVFKTRIELRQIGVRDETKIVGGIGICGRPLCCHSYLSDFIPVSIKMAKEQNLSLNPTKISGVCGRLMCCLKNEEETYEELNKKLPGIGDYVTTEDGLHGEVQSVNVLRQLVKVIVEEGDEKEIKEYPVEKLQFKRRRGKKEKLELSREELQELERLEEEELQEEQETETKQGEHRPGGKNRQDNRNRQDNPGRNGQRQGGGYRQEEQRQNDGQRQDSVEHSEEQRQNDGQRQDSVERSEEQRQGSGYRQEERRSYGGPRGGYRQGERRSYDGQRQGSGYRQEERRSSDSQRVSGSYRQEEQRQGSGYRQEERRSYDGQRQSGYRQEERRSYDGQRQSGYRQEERRSYDGQRQGNGYRQNERRQNGSQRQEGGYRQEEQRPYDGQHQGGRSRYNRYKNNARPRQEGQPKRNDNQSEGE